MLLIFNNHIAFEQLAHSLDALSLELVNVHACVFPSRPEPKQAQWAWEGRLILAYLYEPDIELRYLWRCGIWPWPNAPLMQWIEAHQSWLTPWAELETDLHGSVYTAIVRAAAALRVRVLRGETAHDQQEALLTLMHCLETSQSVHTRRVIARELEACAQDEVLSRMQHHMTTEEDVQTRLHLHQAIQMVQTRQLF